MINFNPMHEEQINLISIPDEADLDVARKTYLMQMRKVIMPALFVRVFVSIHLLTSFRK